MKHILILISVISLSFSGTVYLAYDVDETENVTLGYNHTFKTWICEETGNPSWILVGGANYDVVNDGGGFASIYALPMKPVSEKIALWLSLGYATTVGDWSDTIDGGLTYGLGLHYSLNESMGMGFGMVNHDWEMDFYGLPVEDTLEKMNVFFSYKF
tara:strand:- start:117 stop:587 length:471 start_codon:yes stop_codon:yes gene_type:complete